MEFTQVGDSFLHELPPGWEVAVDTEGSGLYKDGEPFKSGSNPPQPEARISVVSVSYRQPLVNGKDTQVHGEPIGALIPGELLDFAWPFDQGPVIGKPGRPDIDPETGEATFVPIDQAEQDRILTAMSKVLRDRKESELLNSDQPIPGEDEVGRPLAARRAVQDFSVTIEEAAPNLSAIEYANLIGWLDRRDNLIMHNSIHDMPMFEVGLRAGAGGNPNVPEGFAAWDPDSEPGTWDPLGYAAQRINMMQPTLNPLIIPGNRRRQIRCTMVIQKQLIDPLEPAALKKTAKRLWGEEEGTEAEELHQELSKLGVRMTKRYDLLP